MFKVPEEASKRLQSQMASRGGANRRSWDEKLLEYGRHHPQDYRCLRHILEGTLPTGWDSKMKTYEASAKGLPTRKSSGQVLNQVAEMVPSMLGGSADLASSCLTGLTFAGAGDFMHPSTTWGAHDGRNIHFGIREHAMGR
jgi:transketolase